MRTYMQSYRAVSQPCCGKEFHCIAVPTCLMASGESQHQSLFVSVVKLLLISLLLSFCPPSGKLFFSITIENPFLHIRLQLYDTFLTGSIFFFRTVNQLSCIIEKKVLFVFTFIHIYGIPLRFILRTILAILFFKVGLCCITSGNLIACEYSRDMIFYNYSIKPFSFFGAESFTFIATIKYCWRLLRSSDTEQCWPVVYNDWIFLNLSS